MDLHTLQLLADSGFDAVPTGGLAALVEWCWDHSANTGDARFSWVARALAPAAAQVEASEEAGGVPSALLDALTGILRAELRPALAVDDPRLACAMLREMRSSVGVVLSQHP